MVTNINKEIATIKIIDQDIIEPPLLQFTISILEDLEEQFFTLWMKAHKVLKAYNALNNMAELEHIYSLLPLNRVYRNDACMFIVKCYL